MSEPAPHAPDKRARSPLVLFGVVSLVCLVALAAITWWSAQILSSRQTESDARARAAVVAATVVAEIDDPNQPPAAQIVRSAVMEVLAMQDVQHVLLWDSTGTVLWSDDEILIGRRFSLGPELRDLFGTTRVVMPDERPHELLPESAQFEDDYEVYTAIELPSGQDLVVESYVDRAELMDHQRATLTLLLPFALTALLLLQGSATALSISLIRQRRKGRQQRIRLASRAAAALDKERRDLAHRLHDGLVQDLAAMRYALSSVATELPDDLPQDPRGTLNRVCEILEGELIELRGMLGQLISPDLELRSLEQALQSLVRHIVPSETRCHLVVDCDVADAEDAKLVYRVVREAVRNAVKHGEATSIDITVTAVSGPPELLRIIVEDDGHGLGGGVADLAAKGHFGLWLIEELLQEHEGNLHVADRAPTGVRVVAELVPQGSVAGERVHDPQTVR